MRFQGVIEGLSVNNQIVGTLKQIHCWSKIQSEIRARRLSMVTQGRDKQKKIQNQQKLDAKLHELEVSTLPFIISFSLCLGTMIVSLRHGAKMMSL